MRQASSRPDPFFYGVPSEILKQGLKATVEYYLKAMGMRWDDLMTAVFDRKVPVKTRQGNRKVVTEEVRPLASEPKDVWQKLLERGGSMVQINQIAMALCDLAKQQDPSERGLGGVAYLDSLLKNLWEAANIGGPRGMIFDHFSHQWKVADIEGSRKPVEVTVGWVPNEVMQENSFSAGQPMGAYAEALQRLFKHFGGLTIRWQQFETPEQLLEAVAEKKVHLGAPMPQRPDYLGHGIKFSEPVTEMLYNHEELNESFPLEFGLVVAEDAPRFHDYVNSLIRIMEHNREFFLGEGTKGLGERKV